MAMNKREKEELEAAHVRAALGWSAKSMIEPDLTPPKSNEPLTTGYAVLGSSRVDIGCSSSRGHSTGRTDRTSSQGARPLYSKKSDALKALRYKIEMEAANNLRNIDKMIEKAEFNESKTNDRD